MIDLSWPVVVDRINHGTGARYTLVRPLTGGRQGGAWVVQDESIPTSGERVLTWSMNAGLAARRQETAALVGELRRRGYPTPVWRAWGGFDDGLAFVVADLFAGVPVSWEDLRAAELIDAVERQADAARPGSPSWSDYMRGVLSSDEGPRGDVAMLGAVGAQFLRQVDDVTRAFDGVVPPATDAVHGDLEAGNILRAPGDKAGGLLGIVDVDACGPGTRAIDYAWLVRDATAHAAPTATIDQLRHAGLDVAGPGVWAACLAFACIEVVGFVARSGNRAGAQKEAHRLEPLLVGLR